MADDERAQTKGFEYRPRVVGKFHFRIRERHIAETYVPLLADKKVGAVKLDLALRGIALLPAHAGRRPVGSVLPRISYEDLYGLCQIASRYRLTTPEDEIHDPAVLAAKRNWVGRNLAVLEEHGAVQRLDPNRGRPALLVQRDHGTGAFDDPDGSTGNSYVTISGPVLARWLHVWGAPEVAAYLAASIADRYARLRNPGPAGGAQWFQTLDWFADSDGHRPVGHVRTPFAVRTLERGLARLRADGLVTWTQSSIRPDQPTRRFRSGRRNIYVNHFAELDQASEAAATPIEQLLAEKN